MSGSRRAPFYLSLSAGILIVLASVYGFHLLRSRPGLPDGIKDADIVRIDDHDIGEPGQSRSRPAGARPARLSRRALSDLELVLAKKTIRERTTVQVRRFVVTFIGSFASYHNPSVLVSGAVTETLRVQIIPFYSKVPFPTIYLVIGLLSFLIGFLVLLFRWEDRKARILYWLAAVFSLCVIVNGGTYCLRSSWTTYVPMALFYLFYPLAPALLVHFSFAFLKKSRALALAIVYGASLLFGCAFTVLVLLSMRRLSTAIFRGYAVLFSVFRGYLVALLLLAIFTFIQAYRRATLEESRAQIKWIFLGLVLGLAPFIFLYQVPRVLGFRPPLTEDAMAVFFIFAPLGLALAIFRFRFLDVEIVINRSLVYSLLTVLTAGIYLFWVAVFRDLPVKLFASTETAVSLGSALLAAVAFQPARRRIQSLVDKSFFRKSYDYKQAILKFNEAARGVPSQAGLADFLAAHIQTVLPAERLAVIIGAVFADGCRLLNPEHAEPADCISLLSLLPSGRVCARRESVSTEEGIDFSQADALSIRRWEMALPIPFRTPALRGLMLLGKKRSGQRFTPEDIELLQTLAMDLSLNLERLRLQEEVIYERAAKEKLDELNRLKTEFVSTVSHELRTPLTSIQGLSEILETGKVTDRGAREEIHHALAAESARLSRFLHNILDFGKIEQQTKTYDLRAEDIGLIIRELVKVFRPQLEEGAFAVDLNLPPHPVHADVDRDAIEQLMINLIDNAMKYSSCKKQLGIDLLEGSDKVEIRVRDQGIGIAPEEMERIFANFYRGSCAAQINPKGVGLGLKIVRHIVEAHRGEVLVESRLSEGSTFRVIIPRSKAS